MTSSKQTTRRGFVQVVGFTAGAVIMSRETRVAGAEVRDSDRGPDAVLAQLLAGNRRFAQGQSIRQGREPEDFARDAKGQAPLAAIVACADSRVAPELVFDQGVGDLFVVRVAGNIFSGAGPIVKGSIEFAVAELGCRLVMVLGHSKCGAVAAAIKHLDDDDALPGAIGSLVTAIRPAVIEAKNLPGDRLDNTIKANVRKCVDRLKRLDPIVSEFVETGRIQVVGGVYELSTGKVEMVG